MLISLLLSKTNYFFFVSIPSLPWVLSVCITMWQHSDSCYLQRQCVCYLSLSNIQKQLHPSLLSCKMRSGQGMHTEKITPLARYFDTKNLSSSKMKAPCHSVLITASFLSMHREANSLCDVTGAFTNMQSGIWPERSLHGAQPGLSPRTLIGVIFHYNL